jgi:hypothetical protein
MNPLYSRGEVRLTTMSEIRLDFLDVNADESCPLNGDITKQVNPAGNKSDSYMRRETPTGHCFAASIHQRPVPQPRSRTPSGGVGKS